MPASIIRHMIRLFILTPLHLLMSRLFYLSCNACFFLFVPVAVMANAESAQSESDLESRTVRQIVINRKPIFDIGQIRFPHLSNLINSLHVVTREHVIRREVWHLPGDQITQGDALELERNLRALDLFAEVKVKIEKVAHSDSEADLHINTRDRLSIIFSGGGSFLGGVGEVKFSVGERNLLGFGHRLLFGYAENSNGELLGSVAYDNILLANNDVFAAFKLGQTEEGDFSSIEVENRFLNFQDNLQWLFRLSQDETRVDYYKEGDSIAEVPRTINKLEMFGQRRHGAKSQFWRFGPVLTFREIDYGTIIGSDVTDIEVPLDLKRWALGASVAFDSNNTFKKFQWLDTLSYIQDLTFGSSSEFYFGMRLDENIRGTDVFPTIGYDGWTSKALGDHNFIAAEVATVGSLDDATFSNWFIKGSLQWYNAYFRHATLAVNIEYETAGNDGSTLPPQQSLGEDVGLRGYPAREFNGEQLILLNIENRLKRHVKFANFEIGFIGFFDVGWVNQRGDALQDSHSSAGFGIRLGSRALLGRDVIRLDLAYPFNKNSSKEYEPTVSLALGHVFKFGQNR